MKDGVPEPQPGGHIHSEDPFRTPPHVKAPARRLRGRLAAPVTIWTSGRGDERTGLTMSSVLIAEGEPSFVIGLINDTTDLWDEIQDTRRWVMHVLPASAAEIADRFAGRRPSPGGLFVGLKTVASDHGPVLTDFPNRAYCRLLDTSASGYQRSIRGAIDHIDLDDLDDALIHFRATYRRLD